MSDFIHNGQFFRIKRAHSPQLRDEVYCLRYRAYRKEDAIEPNDLQSFEDQYDHQPNHVIWALTCEERVIGSIRTTWFDPEEPYKIPEMQAYGDVISSIVPSDARILSGNRLVTEPDLVSVSSRLVLILLRHYMVVARTMADWAIAAARTNHLAFYRRVLHLEKVSEGRIYPGLRCPMHLMACDFHENFSQVIERTPLLKPRGYEKMFLDPNYQDVWEIGLPVEA